LFGSFTSTAGQNGPKNVYGLDLFDSLESGASVYLCTLVKREAFSTSNHNIERGKANLKIVKTLHGNNRDSLILPYSFYPTTADYRNGELVWPGLDDLKGTNSFLCVVVPAAEDLTAFPSIPGIREAASKVVPVSGENDTEVQSMATACKVYETFQITKSVTELERAAFHPSLEVRQLALKITIMKLGSLEADKAMSVVQAKTASYTGDDPKTEEEAMWLIRYLQRTVRHVDVSMDPFLVRCLATIAGSQSVQIREQAIGALKTTIDAFKDLPRVNLQDSLTPVEKASLRMTVERALQSKNVVVSSNAAAIRQWLSN
jgi:hypothetical protein